MIIDATKPQESITAHPTAEAQKVNSGPHSSEPKKDSNCESKKTDSASTNVDGMKATAKFDEKSSGSPMVDKKI